MTESPADAKERARLAALAATRVLDTAQESCFDALTHMASEICETPVALVSLVDEHRQWFKSRVGFGATETPREFSFCAHAIETPDETMVVEDATKDPRFDSNPLVVGPPGIRFYAGVPLVMRDGAALGTLCVIDREPRQLTSRQLLQLQALADHARAQLELRRAFSELNSLTWELRERAAALGAANEALDAFAYSASHDLRAPLRRIALLADSLVEDTPALASESKEVLSRIRREAMDLGELVKDLLLLGQATTGAMEVVPVDLEAMTRECERRLQATEPDRHVEFQVEGDLLAHGDAKLLRVALANLLENSWKYTSEKDPARIRVTGERGPDRTLVVHVEDNGIGFDPAEAKGRLFSPFQRLTTGAKFAGTGVGLATVRRVVERHGGRVWAESAPGQGATFHFTLPEHMLRVGRGEPAPRSAQVARRPQS